MSFRIFFTVFLLLVLCIPVYGTTDTVGDIVVNLTGFRTDQGYVKVVLYESEDGYPGSHDLAVGVVTGTIADGVAEVVFPGIPYGYYAMEALHDENANGQMDTNWLKMPKEGYGFSNNAKGLMGPPSFTKAKFLLSDPVLTTTLEMNYL